jgi:S-formylglutathione hydrolase
VEKTEAGMVVSEMSNPHNNQSRVQLADVPASFTPHGVPCAFLLPPGYDDNGPYPLCLFLHGGGGSRENLVALKPVFDRWWADGLLPPMVLACASTGATSYYLDHRDGGPQWETFVAETLLWYIRDSCNVRRDPASTLITGISMGGLGALKIAFKRPHQFAAVAAVQPMIEPGLRSSDVGARNRFHYIAGGPEELIGPNRDAALFEANNPANRARSNADAIRESGLAIFTEAGDDDSLNAHDGAEFLHRILWDLDISHEYRLIRGADHGGPTLLPRLRDAFAWLGSVVLSSRVQGVDEITPAERAWGEWVEKGMKGNPPPVDSSSKAFIRVLRAQLKPARDRAAATDPTTARRYDILPKTSILSKTK